MDRYVFLLNRIVQAVPERRNRARADRFERLRKLAYEMSQALVRADNAADVALDAVPAEGTAGS